MHYISYFFFSENSNSNEMFQQFRKVYFDLRMISVRLDFDLLEAGENADTLKQVFTFFNCLFTTNSGLDTFVPINELIKKEKSLFKSFKIYNLIIKLTH